jgi:hypothetical protein
MKLPSVLKLVSILCYITALFLPVISTPPVPMRGWDCLKVFDFYVWFANPLLFVSWLWPARAAKWSIPFSIIAVLLVFVPVPPNWGFGDHWEWAGWLCWSPGGAFWLLSMLLSVASGVTALCLRKARRPEPPLQVEEFGNIVDKPRNLKSDIAQAW